MTRCCTRALFRVTLLGVGWVEGSAMADTRNVKLTWHRSRQVYGRKLRDRRRAAVVLMVLGVAIIGASMVLQAFPALASQTMVPPLLLGMLSVFVWGPGVVMLIDTSRHKLQFHQGPQHREPWRFDHPWSPGGTLDDGDGHVGYWLGHAAVIVLAVSPFVWSSSIGKTRPQDQGLALFGLAVAGMFFVHGMYRLLQRRKYGRSRIRFERFPYFVDEPVAFHFRIPPALVLDGPLQFTLRHIQERQECVEHHDHHQRRRLFQRRKKRRYVHVSYQVWADTLAIPAHEVRMNRRGGELRVQLDAPGCSHVNRLMDWPPAYWELEVRAETPGIDYRATFLLPIYARATPNVRNP
ncbi:MAG: hypothetical protein AB2A00_05175 [Myxococcota bacterium]